MTKQDFDPEDLHPEARHQPPFADHMGMRILRARPDRIEAEMIATPALMNRNGTLHGGALMAFADHLGGTGAFMNIRPDQSTVTLESKTNFLRPVLIGDRLRAECVPLHIGGKTMLWQTTLIRSDGKAAAIVTQTQIVLAAGKPKA